MSATLSTLIHGCDKAHRNDLLATRTPSCAISAKPVEICHARASGRLSGIALATLRFARNGDDVDLCANSVRRLQCRSRRLVPGKTPRRVQLNSAKTSLASASINADERSAEPLRCPFRIQRQSSLPAQGDLEAARRTCHNPKNPRALYRRLNFPCARAARSGTTRTSKHSFSSTSGWFISCT